MKSSSLSTRNIAVIIVILIVAGIVYFYFEGDSAPAGVNSFLLGTPSSVGSVGSAELTLLNQIRSLKIDTSLFTTPSYTTLQDYSVAIPQQAVGRPNPFAPFPGSPNISSVKR